MVSAVLTNSVFLIILTFCWGLFAIVWIVGWIYNLWRAPSVQRRSRFVPLWLIGLALLVLIRWGAPLPWLAIAGDTPFWTRMIGVACLIVSTGLVLWARVVLGTMWSSAPETKVEHQLRIEGPYRITRHPIYTGLIGMVVGSLLVSAVGTWLLFSLVGIVVVLLKARAEERLLLDTFGEQYRQYQKRVPQLVPGLQLWNLRKKR